MDEHGLAQRFTTGGKSAGYVLQEVSLRIPSTYESRFMSFSARLYAVTAGGAIGNQTAGFSHGATPSAEDWDLTASGHVLLQPNSQYIVQVLCDSGCANDNYIAFAATTSNGEDSDVNSDPSGVAWTLANNFQRRSDDWENNGTRSLVMAVKGRYAVPPLRPDLTVSSIADTAGALLLEWEINGVTGNAARTPTQGMEYRVKESSAGSFTGLWLSIPSSKPGEANDESYRLTSLTNGLSHDVQVRALNQDGPSGASATASAVVGEQLGVCSRTRAVQTALATAAGVNDCAGVTSARLSGIQSLSIQNAGTVLKSGDFDGLTSLTLLYLSNIGLTALPGGVFDDLSSLQTLYLSNNDLAGLPGGVFDDLTSLEVLYLNGNQLTGLSNRLFSQVPLKSLWLNNNLLDELHPDVFATLTSLQALLLSHNQLSDLPAGLFEDLSQLSTLQTEGNTVDPLPLSVDLERAGQSGFRAVAPVGAPFDIVLPVSVTNGSIAGGAATITIPTGDVESSVLTVTRSVGASAATTVDIGTVPALPANHSGYGLSKAAGLPLTMPGLTVTPTTLTVDEGGGGTYTVVLDTQPSATVTVTIGGTTGTDVSVGDATLEFTTGDWATAQTVTVSAAEDSDTANDTVSLTHTPTGGGYGGVAADSVVVTVEDDDVTALAKPTNLTATAGDGQVALAWDTPVATADITHHEYRYKWSGEAAYPETWTEIADSAPGDANEDEVTVGSLENGLPYDFQIRAVNAMGASEPSDAASALAGDGLGICNRTLTVQTVIVREIAGVSDCADVTAAHLSAITGRIDFVGSISIFKVGDLDGLSSLEELIVQSNSRLTELPAGIFDDLSSLTTLQIGGNAISTLRSDVFSNLSSLTTLGVTYNQLTALPAGVFDGLSSLATLKLENNPVDPLPLSVDLERVGQSGFRAVAPVGAPFDIVLPVRVTNGSIVGGAATIAIPAGDVESSALTVTRSVGASAATTVDIGTVPALPANHSGYGLSKAAGLPLTMPGLTVTPTTLTVDEGGGGTYTVVLDTQPSATVTVTIGGTTGTDVSVGDATLEFTTGDWATAQTVTVSAAEDSDTASDTVSLTHTPTGGGYGGVAADSVVVTVEDDDVTALAKPTNLTATAGDGQVALAWDTPVATADITHHEYRYKWSGEAAYPETWTEIADSAPGDANEDEVTVGSLENGLPYDFQIRAVNAMGASEPSDAASALAGDGLGICNRTLVVQTVIVREIAGVSDCADVTAAHLSAITGRIDFVGSISIFKVGDLDGLSSLEELIVQSNSRLTELPAGIFDDLSSLTTLQIGGNAISTLRSDVFSNLSSLTTLGVTYNQLTALPAGVFDGLSSLATLKLENNPVDPLPLSVDLERVGQSGFRAVAPVGAPFDIVLPVRVTNGSIVGGAATIAIPAGDVESSALTVTRSVGASAATTVDIGTVPALPANHSGYGLSKAAGLPLTMPGLTVTPTTLTVDEGGGGTYTVVLDTQPSATVTVTIGGTTGTDVSVGDATLEFTTGDWATAQTVTVSAAEDSDTASDTVSLTHTPTGGGYGGVAADSVVVTVEDDDVTALAKPTNLTATAGDGQVALAWDTPVATADITHHEYRYKWSGEAAYPETWTEIADSAPGDANEDEVTVGSLENGLPYDFQIRAVNAMGASEPSDAASALAGDGLGICNRTLTVQTVIVREIAGVSDCADVTAAHLSAITGRIDFVGSISIFKVGDLDGLSSLEELIVQSNSRLTELPAGIFDDLSSLTTLQIGGNAISTLRSDVFSNLSSLTTLGVTYNQLTALPAGVFDGLSSLATLKLENNPVDPLPLSVDLERVGQSGFRAVAPVGAPFDIVLPVRVTNGSIVGGAATIAIPAGDVESSALTVTRSVGASAATTVDIGTVPALPANHSGYGLSKAAGLPLTMPGLTVTPTTLTVDEGDGGTYTVVLDTQPSATVTVTIGGTTGTDVSVGDATLEFTTGDWATAQTVTVSAAEDSDTANDTVSLTHSAASTDSDYNGIAIAGVEVTVNDNDTAQVTEVRVVPGNAQLVVDWKAVDNATGYKVQWKSGAQDYNTGDRQATVTPGSTTSHTIGSLANGTEYTVRVIATRTGANDGPPSAEVADTPTMPIGPGVTVSATTLTVTEGTSATYTVVLDTQPTGPVTVTPSRSSGDADVTVSGALTFTPLTWSAPQTVTVTAGQDADGDDDAAVIGHAVGGADYAGETAGSVDVTVADDETPSSGVTLSVSPDAVSEGAGATPITVTASLNGGTREAATPVTVTVGSGTATAGTDFEAATGFTITIPANSASHTGSFVLIPTQDTVDEPAETVEVDGTTPIPDFAVTDARVEIADDDAAPTVTLSLSDDSIGEAGGIATVTASLNHASSEPTTVTVSAEPVLPTTALDYSLSANKVLTIAADATGSTGTVTIAGVDNDVDAPDKTVQVKGAAANSLGAADPADVELTIEDDDTRGVTVSASTLEIPEGNSATYTVVLASEPSGNVTVTPSRSSGDADVTVSGALTFTALNWATAQTVTVSAAQDSDALNDEAAIGHAVSGADYAGETAGSVDVTVDDDETPSSGVTLSVSPDAVSEGAGATPITVTASLNGGTRDAATPVTVTVGSGTATADTDFEAVTGFTITIPADSASHTGSFVLIPTQDTVDEPDEMVEVNGTTPIPGDVVTGAQVEIADDDDAPTVTLSLSDDSIGEAGGIATVTASLDHASSEPTTVTVSVAPDTPATSSDYSLSVNKVLTIAADATTSTGTVRIAGVANDVDAPDKTVTVRGDAGNGLGVTDPTDLTLTIEDDDTRGVTVSTSTLDIPEGNSATYTVVLASEPSGNVTVTPSRSSGDADVTVSGALTFTALTWATAQTVTVSAAQDSDALNDEAAIGHAVGGADYAGETAGSVDVTVDDDETPSSGVTLSVSPDAVSEGAGATPVTVTATLNGGTRDSATPVSVTADSGTATAGTDFETVTGFTITIPANSASHTGSFVLTPTQDTVDEPAETVEVTGAVTGLTVSGTSVEIADDDASPTVTLSLSDDSIGEAGGIATVTASLNHASSVPTTVTVSAEPVLPATALDYSLSVNKVLTIAADATTSTGTVRIAGVANDVDAPDKTVTVRGDAGNGLGVTDPADLTLTIEDNDTRGVRVSATDLQIGEGGDGTYTVVLASQPSGEVTVTPSHSSGDADVTVSGALTFTALTWATAQTVTVSAAQDSDALNDEAAIGHTVGGADYAGVTAGSVDVTVDDDETPSSGVTLSVSPDAVSEGAGATPVTVTAALNGGTRDAATPVTVTVGSGTATADTDFEAVTGFTITIPANSASHTGSFNLTPTQDTVDEPAETVEVTGSVTGLTVSGTSVEIADDDAAPTVTLSLSDDSIGEAGGIATVTASLDHASSEPTTVTVSVAPDTPATSSDYSLSVNKVLTIAADATTSTGTVRIAGVANDVDAPDKTVTVRGDAGNGLGVTDPADLTLTIEDNDTRGVRVSATDLQIGEGGDGTYTVVLASQPSGEVTVTPSHSSGDADVTVSGALTFTALTWATAQTVTVSAAQDSDALNDEAAIGHTVSGADYAGVTAGSVDVTVDDDETPSSGVTLSVSPDAVSEGAGATPVTVTAALNGGTRDAATPVTVTVGSGTATADTDFEAVTGFTITIPANSASHTGSFVLTPTQDTVDEPAETVEVTGAVTGLTVSGTSVEIADDDAAPTVTLSLSDTLIGEAGGIATVTASLNHASSEPTTVTVSVAPDTPATSSDYSLSVNKVLTIAADATTSTGTVRITGVANDVDAPDKTVQVKGAAVNSLGAADPADVELTIEDDDTRGVTVSTSTIEIPEGNSATYTVVLASQPSGNVTVTPARSSGDADVTVSGALTFTALTWATAQTVTVSAAQDSDALNDEAAIGHTVSGADYAGETAGSVDVTVDDDETPSSGVTLSVFPDALGEGAGATPVTVTAALNGGTRDAATPVAVTVGSGTATADTDFEAVTGFTITIPANSASHTGSFVLTPTQDTVDEPAETVEVTGSVTGLTVSGTSVEIADDDAAPTVTLSLSDDSIGEAGGIATVTASLNHASSEPTTVTVSAEPVLPATALDYSLSVNKVLTIAADATTSTGTVRIAGVANDVDAPDKTVTVRGAAVNSLGAADPADVELTIEDDDTRGVTVSASTLDIPEGNSATYTVVLASEPSGNVTVTPSRSSGDADVTVSGALTFTALTWATAQTVTVSAAQDSDALNDEAAIGHTVSGADYAGETAGSVDVTVDDDETPSSGVTLSVSPDAVSEGAGATPVTVTAALNGGTREAATPVTVTVGSGTATADTDFEAVTGFTITIPANSASHTGSFVLTPTQDTVDEPAETVEVNGTTTIPGDAVTGAQVEIADDDAASTVTLSLSDTLIGEAGGVATVTASLDHASSEPTTVTVSVAPDSSATSSDYSLSVNKVLTIAADATTSTGTVRITGVANDVDAPDKTVQVKGAAANSLGAADPADVELTIEDDDTRGVTVSTSTLDIPEGNSATYTVVLASEPSGEVTVTPARSSGDADVEVSGALTFTPLTWNARQTVTVSAAQDSDALDDEAVIGHAVSGADYAGVTAGSVDVTVDDDETPSSGVTLSVSPDAVSEGAGATPVTVTAALNGGTRDAATPVTVTVGSGTATADTDFEAVTGFTITIPADSASHTGSFVLIPTQDTVDEPDETVEVNGTTTIPGDAVTGAQVEIADDDDAPTVTLSLSDDSIGEAGGIATVTASLDHASSEPTTVTVSVAPDTPATSSDYSLSVNKVLTIAADATTSTGTVRIAGVANDMDAPDKTVQVKGAAVNSLGAADPADVELTIEDDDTRGVTVSTSTLDIPEGNSATYTVVLASEPSGDVTVTPARSSGDADVTVSGALTFTPLTWNARQTVTVSAAQDSDALDDEAAIGHTLSGADYAGETAGSVDVTVDDDETPSSGVTLSVPPDAVSEGAGATPVTVTAALNGGTRDAATPVTVTVGSGTATAGTDFEAVTGFTITIPANSASHTGSFVLTPTQDTVDEPDETVEVNGTTPIPGDAVTDAQVEIADDDAASTVTLSLSDTSIGEAGGVATVTASLDHASSEPTTVTVSVAPDTPATSSDYSLSVNKVLTIAADATTSTGTVRIAGVDNDVDAPDKTVQVKGAAVNSLGASDPADVELTIEDDDTRGVRVSATSLDIDEGEDATYTVVLASEPSGEVTVTPSRSSGDADVEVSGALTFTPLSWNAAQTVTVSAAQDSDALDDEAVIGHAVSGADYAGETAGSVDVTVDDDETPSSGVTLSVSPDAVSEGAGATAITVTATLNGGTRDAATPVSVTVGSGTATADTDFGAVTGFTITVPANSASHTGSFILTPTQDTVDEPDETVEVNGTTTIPGDAVTGAQVEIADDDAASTVTLSLSDTSIGEAGGVATVTASLDHASSEPTTVTVSVAPDSPATSSDYSLSANRVLTIAADATTSTGTVRIAGVANDVDAPDKTVQVKGAAVNSLGAADPADVELTIEDDDTRGVRVSATSLDIDEGENATYTVVLASEPSGEVTVTPARSSGDADVEVSGALTFTPLSWNAPQTVTVSAAQDSDALDDEAVIGHAVSGADYAGETAGSVDVTVDDDETPSSGVTAVELTVSPESVEENAGATPVTVTGTLSGPARTEDTEVTVSVGAAGDTATEGTDYATVSDRALTILAGRTSGTATFTLTPTDDDVAEADETLTVAGTTGTSGIGVTGTAVTIADDDGRGVRVSPEALTVPEGGSATYTVRLATRPIADVTVTVGGTVDTDLTVEPLLLTFTADDWDAARTVSVSAGEDADADNDTATLTHTVSGADYGANGVTAADVTVTVSDDETASTRVALAVSGETVDEAAGATEVTVTATLDSAPRSSATAIRVSVGRTGDAAAEGTDYATVDDVTLSIGAGQSRGMTTFTLSVTDDDFDEPDETLTVAGSTAVPGLSVTGTTITIVDDDAPGADALQAELIAPWLSRFGRTVSDQAVQAIGERVRIRSQGMRENQFTLGGRRIDTLFAPQDGSADARRGGEMGAAESPLGFGVAGNPLTGSNPAAQNRRAGASLPLPWGGLETSSTVIGASPGMPYTSSAQVRPSLRDIVMGSSFDYSANGAADSDGDAGSDGGGESGGTGSPGRWSAWGRVAGTRFDGEDGPVSIDGEVATGTLGFDRQGNRWFGGVALSYSEGQGEFTHDSAMSGTVTSTLTSLLPYASYALGERASVWGVLGYGQGELTLAPEDGSWGIDTDISTSMAALGGRGVLNARGGGFELALVSDATLTETVAEADAGLAGAGATSRARLMLEGSGTMRLGGGGTLRPRVEAGLRYDGGDAETGAGIELGAGLTYGAGRLAVEVNARGLVAHQDTEYKEWGFSGSIAYAPGKDGRGLSVNLGSAWGATQSGVQSLWSRPDASGLMRNAAFDAAQRYQAELRYGLDGPKGRARWVPYMGLESGDGSSLALHLGVTLTSGRRLDAGLELGQRQGRPGANPEHEVQLRGALRW